MKPTLPGATWHCLAFCADNARGSSTGVVVADKTLTDATYRQLAFALGYPDTAFLIPTADSSKWNVRFFSPIEELTACIQAALACGTVLARNRDVPEPTSFSLLAKGGILEVEASADSDLSFVRLDIEDSTSQAVGAAEANALLRFDLDGKNATSFRTHEDHWLKTNNSGGYSKPADH